MLSTEGHQASEAAMPPGIKYTYLFEDYLAATRARAWNGVFGRHTFWIRYCIFGAIFLAIVSAQVILDYVKTRGSPDLGSAALTLAGFAGLMAICWLLEWYVVRVAFGRLAVGDADLALNFESDGIHWSMAPHSGTYGWSGIRDVVRTPKRIFLFISKSEAVVLPRRAFMSENAFAETARYVETRANSEAKPL
ncbi:YcxB family protein [Bradyrhizobium yuanmingense]|uniref:YcxB family protein n=1 Tax=Bradyrhizobium yuanmingense TaxID=108015 RepID=UPI000FE349AD|nr:YcxB family protein [Bradyrhizobium yuanmingense]TGN83450.1 YcxB family protein [Bradyrhizobium yuanmingense]